jgi:hypothetical protein
VLAFGPPTGMFYIYLLYIDNKYQCRYLDKYVSVMYLCCNIIIFSLHW